MFCNVGAAWRVKLKELTNTITERNAGGENNVSNVAYSSYHYCLFVCACVSVCPFVCLSVNKITPEPLAISSTGV